ncbi:MAG: methyltransferase domain-containing protein [Hydrococcus sp. SU_1_0]|nr:methyltransferase domain-containing protein [Hydrococcus sp. SU_1_0]
MKYNRVDSDFKYLNLGCGHRFDSRWTNINFRSTGIGVIPYDLAKGIPFADDTFELVYHSHVLEHFNQTAAKTLIQECCRVLRPGGILRVVVPDLEQIASLYLASLAFASESAEWAGKYEWIVLELLDQMVRNTPGGDMATYLSQGTNRHQEFVLERFGAEARDFMQPSQSDRPNQLLVKQIKGFGTKVRQLLPQSLARLYTALKVGYYRQNGEVHQWMYDRYSLSILLKNCGLEQVVQRSAKDSYLDHWTSYNLDTEADGNIYKPDSLFMEAVKPCAS